MAYLAVIALSLLVGGWVYAATVRAGRDGPAAIGFDGVGVAAESVEGPGPGYTFLRVATRGPSWRDRLAGFMGLVILLVVSVAVLAFGIYQLGHLVYVTIERYFGN